MASKKYSKEELSRLLLTNAVSDHNQSELTKILLKKVKGDSESSEKEELKKDDE
jgi:hypothetical protein